MPKEPYAAQQEQISASGHHPGNSSNRLHRFLFNIENPDDLVPDEADLMKDSDRDRRQDVEPDPN